MIALLGCMNIEINRGPSSFNHSLKASRQKKVVFFSVSQLSCRRECTVPSNERSCLKILQRLLGWSFQQGTIQGQQVRFPVFLIHGQVNTKALFHILLFLKKEISALFQISTLPLANKSK